MIQFFLALSSFLVSIGILALRLNLSLKFATLFVVVLLWLSLMLISEDDSPSIGITPGCKPMIIYLVWKYLHGNILHLSGSVSYV